MVKNYYIPYTKYVQKKNLNEKAKKRNISKKIIATTAIVLVTISIVACIMLGILLEPAVKIIGFEQYNSAKMVSSEKTVVILDSEYNDISGKLFCENKIFISIVDIPQHTKDAFISIEDKRFYEHKGVDYRRIFGAIRRNAKAGEIKEGASTITQQLVKNTHLDGKKTYTRKIKEVRIARSVERKLTKDEILESYLNVIYFGNGYYGIESASRGYFGIEASKLSLSQSAMLAGLINSPSKYNPIINYDSAVTRKDLVLSLMLKYGKITEIEYNDAISKKILILSHRLCKKHYFSAVLSETAFVLGCKEKDLYNQKLTIITHFDDRIQKKIDKALENSKIDNSIMLSQVLVLCNHSGQILALNGNSNIKLHNMKRQPGSVLKPIICYAPALEYGYALPYTPIKDEKVDFGGYNPSNYKNEYLGWVTLDESLAYSSNIVAVRLLEIVGIEQAKEFAKKCGISFSKYDNSLPLALGAMENGITLKQLANCYQAFANDGKIIQAKYVKSILDKDGNEIYRQKEYETPVMSDITSYYINVMLGNCAKNGTAKLLNRHNIENVCAKTGTVGNINGNTDAYSIAYTPDYTVAVWVGSKDKHSPISVTGGGIPTSIAGQILENLGGNKHLTKSFPIPFNLKEVDINLQEYYNHHRLVKADSSLPLRHKKTILVPKNHKIYNSSFA